MFETNISGHNKIWGVGEIWGHCPRIPRLGYGPDHIINDVQWVQMFSTAN